MPLREHLSRPFLLTSTLVLAVTASLLLLIGGGKSLGDVMPADDTEAFMAQATVTATPGLTTPVSLASTPLSSPAATAPATPAPATAPAVAMLTPDELKTHQPNELGVVPILEYHVITTNPEEEAQFARLADKMRADLQWLYDHDFHIVPLRDVFNNTIQVPAGKHPVALTFDDGQSSQFSFLLDEQGQLVKDENGDPVPDPDTAVGILEAFYKKHPDFGRGGHFAPLIFNAFANPDEAQEPYFEEKLHWLVEHGYEVGNHTKQHNDLYDMPTDEFTTVVAEPIAYMDKVLGDIPENQARILTLPYGNSPDVDLHPDQRQMMRNGIPYNGETYLLTGALLVGADPANSPASTEWDPMWVPRIQAFDESLEFWFGMFESGDSILYTSDGNPDTIAVPNPLPPSLEGTLASDRLAEAGKTVISYDPATGKIASASEPDIRFVAVEPGRSRERARSGTAT